MDVELEALISLNASVDCLTRTIQAEADARARSTSRPQPFWDVNSKAADTSGNCFIGLQACPQGEWWALRRLVIGGVTWTTTATGSAVVFVSTSSASSFPADTDLPLFNIVDEAGSLPNIAFYEGDSHLVSLSPNEKVGVRIYGGTSAQTYVVAASFDKYQLGTYGAH